MTARTLFPAAEFSGDGIAQLDADVPGTLWERIEDSGSNLRVINGWLAEEVGHHTCAGGTAESSYAHEPHCGIEPLRNLHHEHVTIWRIVSKDPDEIEEHSGRLLPGPDQVFTVLIDGDTLPTTFPRQNSRGITVWRKS